MKAAAVSCPNDQSAVTVTARDDEAVLTGVCSTCHEVVRFQDQSLNPNAPAEHALAASRHISFSAVRDEAAAETEPEADVVTTPPARTSSIGGMVPTFSE
jgi:hypothetical protein